MTCKDCYHYDVCHRRINSIDFLPFIKGKVSISPIMYKKCDDVENHCLHFIDKSLIVELPYRIGDEVYYIAQMSNKIVAAKVFGFSIDRSGIFEYELEVSKSYTNIVSANKVFSDKSKAEAKLKELNGNEQEKA